MKEKKVLWSELAASLLFLIGFFLVRFALQALDINMDGETLGMFIAVTVFIIAVLIYLSGAEKRFLSFSFDALMVAVVGFFLWELKEFESYVLWFALVAFAVFVVASIITAVKAMKTTPKDREDQKVLLATHSLITYGLAAKTVVMGLGAVVVEKLLLPMFVG